jgi:hypothetical protein
MFKIFPREIFLNGNFYYKSLQAIIIGSCRYLIMTGLFCEGVWLYLPSSRAGLYRPLGWPAVSVNLIEAVLSAAGVAFDEAERAALDTDEHLKTAGVKR